MENPPAGKIAMVNKLTCKKCGFENSGDVAVVEEPKP